MMMKCTTELSGRGEGLPHGMEAWVEEVEELREQDNMLHNDDVVL